MSSNKQYGLQMPKKLNQPLGQKHAAFGDDSDSDKSDKGSDWVKKSLKRDTERSVQKRQTRLELQKALEQDATVFQYDEVYDQIEQRKQESLASKSKDKKPRYIQHLLSAAERRKIENERRVERQVQKEREAEGEEFKDKETFVTSAYKKKLEEFAKLDEEQKRQDMLEEIGDVTKQQDISGFYRHLYQTTVEGKDSKQPSTDSTSVVPKTDNTKPKDKKESRQYRKRKSSASSDDKDKDSDLSSSSSSSSSSDDSESEDDKSTNSDTDIPKRKRTKEENPATSEATIPADITVGVKVEKETKDSEVIEPKICIWEKRTVGVIFDEAVKRYLERKAVRLLAH